MEYGITFVAAILFYYLASLLNPMARGYIQQTALLKYRERGIVKYKLVHSKKKILKELIYTKTLDHVDIEHKIEAMYFFDRNGCLKVYDGHHIRGAREEQYEELLAMFKVSFFNIYNVTAVKRFKSYVRGDYYYEEDIDE